MYFRLVLYFVINRPLFILSSTNHPALFSCEMSGPSPSKSAKLDAILSKRRSKENLSNTQQPTSTHQIPSQTIDITKLNTIEEFPNFDT
jgi:hypothetical protein